MCIKAKKLFLNCILTLDSLNSLFKIFLKINLILKIASMKKSITFNCIITLLLLFVTNVNAQNASVSISPAGPTVCDGTTLSANTTGMNGPFIYLWSTGETTPTIIVNNSGSYRVRVTGQTLYNGVRTVSSALVPYTVVVSPTPQIAVKGNTNLCPGDSVKLIAKGRRPYYSYSWSNGSNLPYTYASQSGTYALTTSTNAGGCNYSASTTVDINVYDNGYQPAVNALSSLTVCKPGFVDLVADQGFSSYEWHWFDGTTSGGSSANQAVSILMDGSAGGTVLDTSTVYLTVQLNGTCKFSSSGTVIRSIRQVELRSQDCGIFNFNSTDSIKCAVVLPYLTTPQYEFEFEETAHPGITWTYISNTQWCRFADVTPALQPTKFYNVRVRPYIDGVGYCYGSVCQIGIATLRPNHTTLSFAERADGTVIDAQIFPNPSSSEFNLVLNSDLENAPAVVTITDLSGRTIDTFNFDGSQNTIQFGKNLMNGLYMITVEQGAFKNVTRILKTN